MESHCSPSSPPTTLRQSTPSETSSTMPREKKPQPPKPWNAMSPEEQAEWKAFEQRSKDEKAARKAEETVSAQPVPPPFASSKTYAKAPDDVPPHDGEEARRDGKGIKIFRPLYRYLPSPLTLLRSSISRLQDFPLEQLSGVANYTHWGSSLIYDREIYGRHWRNAKMYGCKFRAGSWR